MAIKLLILFFLMACLGLACEVPEGTLALRASPQSVQAVTNSSSAIAPPSIYFADLQSGPNAGGENVNDYSGAYVTLYGNNFGSSQGNSTVTLNGSNCLRIVSWGASWLWYQKIVVQLGSACSSGHFSVTVNGQSSVAPLVTTNGVSSNLSDFTVRPGHIYCVATSGKDSNPGTFAGGCWATLPHAKTSMSNGDITYAEDGVTATTDDYNYGAVYTLYTSGTLWGGAEGLPKALISYPGATVTLGVANGNVGRAIFTGGGDHYVFAGLKLISQQAVHADYGTNDIRFVANDISCPYANGAAGCVGGAPGDGSDTNYYIGNYIHDTSASVASQVTKLQHAMYIGDGSAHWQIAWNEITNTKGNRSIQVYTSSVPISDIHVHDNVISNGRGVGILFNAEGLENTSDVYNNLVYHVGQGPDFADGSTQYNCYLQGSTNPGNINVFNNTFYDCGLPSGGAIDLNDSPTVNFFNNIVYTVNSQPYFDNGSSNLAGGHNVWFGAGNAPSETSRDLVVDPMFVDPQNANFHLQPGSPAIDSGSAISSLGADLDGVTRPQGAGYDIGAYEYISGTSVSPTPTPNPTPNPTPDPTPSPTPAPTPTPVDNQPPTTSIISPVDGTVVPMQTSLVIKERPSVLLAKYSAGVRIA